MSISILIWLLSALLYWAGLASVVGLFMHHGADAFRVEHEYIAYYGTIAGFIGLQVTKILTWFDL